MAHEKKSGAEKTIEISEDSETNSEDEFSHLLGDQDQFYHLLDYQADDSEEAIDADLITEYLPRGHIKIRRIQTIQTDDGEEVNVQVVETVNDSILSAAHSTIVSAMERNVAWSPEHIVPELLGQEPFCFLDEQKVRSRVIKLWKDFCQKLKEEDKFAKKTGQGSPNNGSRRRKPSKQMVDWLERVESLLMMIEGITPVVRPSPNNRPSKQRGKAQNKRISNVSGHDGSSGPGSSISRGPVMNSRDLDATPRTPSGPRRITGSAPAPGPSGLQRIISQQSNGISTATPPQTSTLTLARGGTAIRGTALNEDSSAVEQRRLDFHIVGGAGPSDDQGASAQRGRRHISSDQGRTNNGKSEHMDDSVTKGKKASELAKKIRQTATYGRKKNQNKSSDSSSEDAEKKTERKRKRTNVVNEDSDLDEMGYSMSAMMTAMRESREIARRDIELRERMFERNQDQHSSGDGGQAGQSTASGSGGSSPSLEQRMTAMERSLQEILRLLGKGDKK